MLPEDQKRILGYFIEEAKDHLNTIEQGLLNLPATMDDPEMLNEVFRAAHSVKGGAAMLGLTSIQRTSHRMEDFFKLLKESPVRPDRDLETMLLQISDGLQEQLEQLQSPFGLTDDQAQAILTTLEPVFEQTDQHLQQLLEALPIAATPVVTPPLPVLSVATPAAIDHPETSALQLVFRSDIPELLREMLTTLKQPDSDASRQQLSQICQRLHSLGEQFELPQWCTLVQTVAGALGNSQQTYRTLAPVAIKDLKQSQELVLAGKPDRVAASAALLALVPSVPMVAEEELALDLLLADALSDDSTDADLANLFTAGAGAIDEGEPSPLIEADDWLDQLTDSAVSEPAEPSLEAVFGDFGGAEPAFSNAHHPAMGPQVGSEELNSLADLFEGEQVNLEDIWVEEDLTVTASAHSTFGETDGEVAASEFADLFQTTPEDTPETEVVATPPTADSDDDLVSLFGSALDRTLAGDEPFPLATADDEEWLTAEAEAEIAPDPKAQSPEPKSEDDFFMAASPAAEAPNPTPPGLDDFFEVASPGLAEAPTDEVDSFWGQAAGPGRSAMAAPASQSGSPIIRATAPPESAVGAAEPSGGMVDPFAQLDLTVTLTPAEHPGELTEGLLVQDPLESDTPPELGLDLETFDRAVTEVTEPSELGLDSSLPLEGLDDWFVATDTETTDSGATDALDSDDEAPDALLERLDPDGEPTATTEFDWNDLAEDDFDLALSVESVEVDQKRGDRPFDQPDFLTAAGASDGADLSLDDQGPASLEKLAETRPEPQAVSSTPITVDGELDDFGALEALLDQNALTPEPLAWSNEPSMEPPPPSPLAAPISPIDEEAGDDDGFSDLEKLLEEADQLGGSAPSMGTRRSGSVNAPRLPRRSNALADQTMRVSVNHLDNLSNLVGELVVNRNSLEQDQERLRQFLDNLLHQVQQLNDVGQRMRDLYERSLLESSLMANRQAFALGNSSSFSGSHATGATFDALEMDRFTGFHTLSQEMIELIVRVREASSDIEFTIDSTDQIARQFRQVTTQLQEGLNKARMVPFGQTADRLPRAVRDISLKCGKEAKLVVEGRDTLIDKMILERLYDPMTHLVNNAIAHGIESPEERLALGKPREGTITLRAFYQGNQTVIYIADNGGGINPVVVKAKALEKGLITPAESQTMSDLEVYDLLFLPGFTTRDQADAFSGRGVGMDVVRTALADIRGAITIESEVGKGTSFTIRLPLTLSITKALSCVNNQARIAFPMDGVEDMFDVPKERIQTDDQGHTCILWRDTLLPFRPLGELLKFNRSLGRGRVYGGPQDEDVISIVVLRSASTFIGLQVDQVIGEQEIVIKQLEGPVPKPTGIAGATVLGDGRVMPIADVLELIDLATGRVRREAPTSLWVQPDVEEPLGAKAHSEPTVLIVDDSITVRELLSMSFNKVGYRVEQARDGQEAWEKLRSGLPCDLVFSDIEMPRMDGLELLSRLQKDEALSQIPIAMLTSRGADRHRQMAVDLGAKGYFTKPYLEEMLLDAAQRMLNGEAMIGPKES